MKKDPLIFFAHILESIDLIEEYSKDKTIQDFMESKSLQDRANDPRNEALAE